MRKYLLFFTPLLVIILIQIINTSFSMISESSDIAVFFGASLLCVTSLSIYLLIKQLNKKKKQ